MSLQQNIGSVGRVVRGAFGVALLAVAIFGSMWGLPIWARVLIGCFGAFAFYAGLRGWCAVRALGIPLPF